jgi:hypothetical protein
MAQRTGEESLQQLIAPSTPDENNRWFPMYLRDILWWDGQYHQFGPVDDAYLPNGAIARLTARTPQDYPVVVAVKAGHNNEKHNQNDVGSFILHADGETLLTDPGRGLYTRQYFGPERYENIFANSYGHSVPRIGGQLQREGREFFGEFINVDMDKSTKQVELEFARAYPVAQLTGVQRQITLDETGTVWLQDSFSFADDPVAVEEAFMTWLDVDVNDAIAIIYGQNHNLQLTIESPEGVHFAVESLTEQSRANAKPGVLKRITVVLPVITDPQFRMRMELIKK